MASGKRRGIVKLRNLHQHPFSVLATSRIKSRRKRPVRSSRARVEQHDPPPTPCCVATRAGLRLPPPAARPLHSPEEAYWPTAAPRPSMKRAGIPCHGLGPTERPTQQPRPGRHDPSACREHGYGTPTPRGQGYAQKTLCDQPSIEPYQILHDQRYCSVGLLAPNGARNRAAPIQLRMGLAIMAPDGDSPAFPLVIGLVEPPAGIEPATSSLPSMRRWFTTLCCTSRPPHNCAGERCCRELGGGAM